jgi:hypothetical protein
LIIELRRAFSPEDLVEEECGICGLPFQVQSVMAVALTNERGELNVETNACPACVEYLGRRNPDRFPTIEEFEEDLKLYPEPIWSSAEEMDRADEDAFSKGYRQSFIRRAQRQ